MEEEDKQEQPVSNTESLADLFKNFLNHAPVPNLPFTKMDLASKKKEILQKAVLPKKEESSYETISEQSLVEEDKEENSDYETISEHSLTEKKGKKEESEEESNEHEEESYESEEDYDSEKESESEESS